MAFFEGERGRMHYRRWPVDQRTAVVVLLPGMGQHSGHYHRFARGLHGTGVELWALDTAGHGLSEGDPEIPGTAAELVADARILVELTGAELPHTPLFVMGHSLGAFTALEMLGVAENPVRPAGLVLCGTPKRALVAGGPTPAAGVPVLALHGEEDRRAPIDAVRVWTQRHESVDLRTYVDAGHDLLHEPVHARVTGDIADWVRDVVVGLARHR